MIYRDTCNAGEHTIRLDGIELSFGADGLLRDPSPEQLAVLTKSVGRAERFPEVEAKKPAAAPAAPTTAAKPESDKDKAK